VEKHGNVVYNPLLAKIAALRKDEMRTARKSRREFKREMSFLEEISDLFLRTFDVLSNENTQEFTESEDASYRISFRI